MSRAMIEDGHPLERAADLVEHVSRTGDSNIFDEDICFEIRQKWLFTLPIVITFLFLIFCRNYLRYLRKKRKLKIV